MTYAFSIVLVYVITSVAFTFSVPSLEPYAIKKVNTQWWLLLIDNFTSVIVKFHIGTIQVGLIFFAGSLAYFIFSVITGLVTDKIVSLNLITLT